MKGEKRKCQPSHEGRSCSLNLTTSNLTASKLSVTLHHLPPPEAFQLILEDSSLFYFHHNEENSVNNVFIRRLCYLEKSLQFKVG